MYNAWFTPSAAPAAATPPAPAPTPATPQRTAPSEESIMADRDKVKELGKKLNLAKQRSTATLNNHPDAAPQSQAQVPPSGISARDNLEQSFKELQTKYDELAGWHRDAAKVASTWYGYWKDEHSSRIKSTQEKVQLEATLVNYRTRIMQLEELRVPAASRPCGKCAHYQRKISKLEADLAKEKSVGTYWKEKRDRELASAQEKIRKLERELDAAKAHAARPRPTSAQIKDEDAYVYTFEASRAL